MKKHNCFLTLAFAVLCAVFCIRTAAEEIQLKDGTKVAGKLVSVVGDVFQVKTDYGEIKIPRSKIVSIGFSENQSAKADSGPDTIPPVIESLQGTVYSNRTATFHAVVPAGWALAPELRKNSKDIVCALKSPDETMFFMVTPEKFSGTLGTYKVLAETQFQEKFRDYEKLAEDEAQLDGIRGIRMILQGKPADKNVSLKFLVYILPYDGRMVRLSFLTLEPLFADAVPTFEKIAASYHSDTALSSSGKPVTKE